MKGKRNGDLQRKFLREITVKKTFMQVSVCGVRWQSFLSSCEIFIEIDVTSVCGLRSIIFFQCDRLLSATSWYDQGKS